MNYEYMKNAQKIQEYVTNMRPAFNKRAVFSDETENYRTPFEPEPGDVVNVRIRTKKNNVDLVYLVYEDKKKVMDLADSKDGFDYYEANISLGTETVRYYFEIYTGKLNCYYNRMGVVREIDPHYSFGIVPGFKTPEWAKGAVMYQIFVDRFCNGDTANDVVTGEYCYIDEHVQRVEDWYRWPQSMDVRDFYGGDLQGVWDKLDYLQGLGVDVIYFNPIFVSPSNHKYDSQDYDYIDPHYGKIVSDGGDTLNWGDKDNSHASKYIKRVTDYENLEASNEFFARFVEEVHKRGMKVILDGVFNHCGSFNKWLDRERIYEHQEGYEKGAYITGDSPYRTFFRFHNEFDWPYNQFYDGWWGHDTLPKLNYEDSPMLYEYIMKIARKWVSPPYNVDGWRLDVAADLGHSNEYNHQFWRDFRKNVKEANPEAIILAEHYGEAKSWLQGDQWDTVMNYDAFMEPVTWFLTGMEKHSDSSRPDLCNNADYFVNAITHHMSAMTTPSLQTAMNELSNHDHSRFLTRTNHMTGRVEHLGHEAAESYTNSAILREAVVMQMTWPGAPTIYYGDEAGVCGFTDPDNRRTYPWGHEDKEMIEFHKEVIAIHKRYWAFRTGSVKMLMWQEGVLAYARFNDRRQFVIIVNNRSEAVTLHVPVWPAEVPMQGFMRRMIYTYEEGYTTEFEEYIVENGEIVLNMGKHSAIILKKREY